MSKPMDFTKPWLRGKRVIPRRGDQPPRLEDILKVIPIKDPVTGKAVVPQVILGVPGSPDHRIKLKDGQDKDKT